MSCWKNVVKSWRTSFNLNSVSEVYFWKSQWETFDPSCSDTYVSHYYFWYRFLYMSWFVVSFVAFFSCAREHDYLFFIFLTNQTFTIQVVYSMIYCIYILWKLLKQRQRVGQIPPGDNQTGVLDATCTSNRNSHLSLFNKLLWISMNVVFVIPYAVSGIYWIVLQSDRKGKNQCQLVRNHLVHSFNSPAAFIDSLVISVPIRFTHFLFPVLIGLWYSIFAIAYELSYAPLPNNKTAIYDILDWNKDGLQAAATSIGGMIGGVVGHTLFCWGTYHLRVILSKIFKIGPKYPSADIPLLLSRHQQEENVAIPVESINLEIKESGPVDVKDPTSRIGSISVSRPRQSNVEIISMKNDEKDANKAS